MAKNSLRSSRRASLGRFPTQIAKPDCLGFLGGPRGKIAGFSLRCENCNLAFGMDGGDTKVRYNNENRYRGHRLGSGWGQTGELPPYGSGYVCDTYCNG